MKVTKVCQCSECALGMTFCPQCGRDVCNRLIAKRLSRKHEKPTHCVDCLRKPALTIEYDHPVLGKTRCVPWVGEIDADCYPVDDLGERYRPGIRICGHNDCVSLQHIVLVKENAPLVMGGLEEQPTEKV